MMFEQGWLEEVRTLCGTAWEPFLREKKLIGYDDLLNCSCGNQGVACHDVVARVQQKTRWYAKRQCSYFAMLAKKLRAQQSPYIRVIEVDLTQASPTLYMEQVFSELMKVMNHKE